MDIERDDAFHEDGFTTNLIEKLASIRQAGIDEPTRKAASRHLLDTVGLIYAGSREPVVRLAASALSAIRAPGSLSLPGSTQKVDVLDAAYLMAVASHCLEFDDGYRAGAAHPGSVVVPVALAVAVDRGASGEALLEAIVAGYEAMTSVARVAKPALQERGFHPTPAVGVFGGAAAAAHLLGLDKAQLRAALGLAASSAGGLFTFTQGGEDVKPLHVGHAAREGLFAALLANAGAEGPPYAIEGSNGFFSVFARAASVADHHIGPGWGVTDCYVKPWPGCRHPQAAIDAALQLRRAGGFDGSDIESVHVETYRLAADGATVPWTTRASALLSFPFLLATALVHGDVALEHFSDAARADATIADLASRISFSSSDQMEEGYRRGNPAKVSIVLRDGRRFDLATADGLGAPGNPLHDTALADKFIKLLSGVTALDNARDIHARWASVGPSFDARSAFDHPL